MRYFIIEKGCEKGLTLLSFKKEFQFSAEISLFRKISFVDEAVKNV